MQRMFDEEILQWICCLGAAGTEHVAQRFELRRRVARERLEAMRAEGVLACSQPSLNSPVLYWTTNAGLRSVKFRGFGEWSCDGHDVTHVGEVARVAAILGGEMFDWDVLSTRELAAMEAEHSEPYVSVAVSIDGAVKAHLPSLALCSHGDRVVAIEVEPALEPGLSLVSLCRAWRAAKHVDCVYWLAKYGPAHAVRRAVRDAHASDRITVLGLDDLKLLIATEFACEEAEDGLL